MCWATNYVLTHYFSSSEGNIDTISPITPGESVLLRKGENEFRVLVTAVGGNTFEGTVVKIGPAPSIETNGIRRGKSITFNQTNVFRVYRDARAT